MEIMARHQAGEIFPANLFSVLLRDMAGDFSGIAMFSMDMSRLRTAEEAVDRIKLEHERQIFLTKLIEDNEPVNADITRKAAELGMEFPRPFAVAVLEVSAPAMRQAAGAPALKQLLGWVSRPDGLVWEYHNSLILLSFETAGKTLPQELVGKPFRQWESQLLGLGAGARLLMGIGRNGTFLADVRESYRQARQAAWFCQVMNEPGKPCYYKDLGIFQLFTPIWEADLDAFGQQVLGKLLNLKPLKREEYMATLEVLLNSGRKRRRQKSFMSMKRR